MPKVVVLVDQLQVDPGLNSPEADTEVAVTGEIHLLCLSQQYCGS